MLTALDQFALNILISTFTFFGIQSLPPEPSTDWKVVKAWELNSEDKTYSLELESDTISSKCTGNPNDAILFPPTYLAQQEIFGDSHRIYDNTMSKPWRLRNVFEEPAINCDQVAKFKTITVVITSYVSYFNQIPYYPRIAKVSHLQGFFNTHSFTIAFSICFAFALVGIALLAGIEEKSEVLYYLALNFSLALMVMSYYPGFLLDLDIKTIHILCPLSIWTSALLVVRPFIFEKKEKLFLTLLGLASLIPVLFYNHKNVVQLLMSASLLPILVLFSWVTYVLFSKKNKFTMSEKAIFMMVFFLSSKDTFASQITRSAEYFHLGVLASFVSVFNFLKVIKAVQAQAAEVQATKSNLEAEKRMVDKISSVSSLLKEVIHDLKSPLTAFQMFLARDPVDRKNLNLIAGRIRSILDRIDSRSIKRSADWFSISVFEKLYNEIIAEKIAMHPDLDLHFGLEIASEVEVFFDPLDLQVCVSEVIDNALKYKSKKSNIEATLDIGDGWILYACSNYVDVTVPMFTKGMTLEGSGYGLHGINSKLHEIGASAKFSVADSVFTTELKFRSRQPSAGKEKV